ncbi:MAG: MFS transporter [Alphaproteobacteria bacterium]|nr:MFS transporter [Alphaproteobacteria bacterium]
MAALRDAVLYGHEPAPLPWITRRASYRWYVVGTVCIGAFMGQVDASMTQMLLPRLEADFHARISTVSWVAVAYILAMATFMPTFGRLADMVSRKLLYTAGFLSFVLGSALCGFAPTLGVLIAFRVLQGIGAALITANSIAIVVMAARPEDRGRALGLQSAAQAVGLGAGPAIGGFILDTLGWHWLFWVNVPVGLVGALIGWLVLPQARSLKPSPFDWRGALLIGPALTALIALLNQGYAWGPTSPLFIGCGVLALVFLLLFVRAERGAASPLIDFALLRKPAFVVGNIANLLAFAMLFGLFFLIPFVLMRVYHDSALAAGLRLSLVPVMLGLTAPVGGILYDRFGARVATASGMVVCVAALAILYVFLDGTRAHLLPVTLGLALFGVGQGLFVSPNTSAVMATAPADLTGEAGSLVNVVRFLGVSSGIAGASSLLALTLAAITGHDGGTVGAPLAALVVASHAVILLLAAMGMLSAALSLMRSAPHGPRRPDTAVAVDLA